MQKNITLEVHIIYYLNLNTANTIFAWIIFDKYDFKLTINIMLKSIIHFYVPSRVENLHIDS